VSDYPLGIDKLLIHGTRNADRSGTDYLTSSWID